MIFFKNILVALDYKDTEQAEIDHALILAKSHEAKITFISVIPPLPKDAHLEISAMSPDERLQLQIQKREGELESISECIKSHDIDVKIIAVAGTPSTEIIKQVIRNQHDLLMLSEREHSTMKNKLIGGTARQVLRKCPCPVLAVHPDQTGEYNKVMLSIDVSTYDDYSNSDLNDTLVSTAKAVVEADQSKLSILNIPPNSESKAIHLSRIEDYLERHQMNLDKGMIILQEGNPTTVIPEISKQRDVDLLIMGMLSRTGIKGFFIGNVAEKILDNVECSVLTIKPKEFVSPITLDDK